METLVGRYMNKFHPNINQKKPGLAKGKDSLIEIPSTIAIYMVCCCRPERILDVAVVGRKRKIRIMLIRQQLHYLLKFSFINIFTDSLY